VIDFLIENNYADNEVAASKILDAASPQFVEFLLQEMTQREYENHLRAIQRARTPEEKAEHKKKLQDAIDKQRGEILTSKPKRQRKPTSVISKSTSYLNKKIEPAKRFTTKTALGALSTALIGF
jgi:hypothetical protein